MWGEILKAWKILRDSKRIAQLTLYLEPGRALVRSAGWFFVSVTDVKDRPEVRYVLVDSSATWYPRALLHESNDHFPVLLGDYNVETSRPSAICGSSTFSKDFLARAPLPLPSSGQIIAFALAGAYCQGMHLDFLGFDRPDEVWLE
jgi:diaminopimelate decarboxylase